MGGIEVSFRVSAFGRQSSAIPGVESIGSEESMSDPTPNSAPVPPATPGAPANTSPLAAQRGPTINISDEFGTAKRTLPPVKMLLLAMAGVFVIVGIAAFLQRAKPQAAGS